jgi:hypothetical protein
VVIKYQKGVEYCKENIPWYEGGKPVAQKKEKSRFDMILAKMQI